MLPSLLSLPHSWDFLLPAPYKVSRFLVRFRFHLILSKRFRDFLLPASYKVSRFLVRFRFHLILSKRFRFLLILSNCMLTAQDKTENLVCRISD